MLKDFQKSILGSTGLKVGRLGLAASYGAPAEAFEEAFEKGCNYFYFGSGIKRAGMKKAIRNISARGKREEIIISIQTYARRGFLTGHFFKKILSSLNIEYADVLILGWHNKPPSKELVEMALSLKEKGLVKFLGMSGHNRSLFHQMAKERNFDLFHIRYNAAHRGAEDDSFPYLKGENPLGIATYTATRWGNLLKSKYMPKGEPPLKASDCYRFVLSNPLVDVCLCGPKNINEMREALSSLELGLLDFEEFNRIKRIGDHVHNSANNFFYSKF